MSQLKEILIKSDLGSMNIKILKHPIGQMQRQAGLTLLSLNGLSPRIPEASDTEP